MSKFVQPWIKKCCDCGKDHLLTGAMCGRCSIRREVASEGNYWARFYQMQASDMSGVCNRLQSRIDELQATKRSEGGGNETYTSTKGGG